MHCAIFILPKSTCIKRKLVRNRNRVMSPEIPLQAGFTVVRILAVSVE